MKIDDVIRGETYTLSIEGKVKNVQIFNDPMLSKPFLQKYKNKTWGSLSNKNVKVIEFLYGYRGIRNGVKLHLLSDNDDCWAIIDSAFLKPMQSSKIDSCRCDLWISGCRCGVFNTEQNPKPKKIKQWKYIEV